MLPVVSAYPFRRGTAELDLDSPSLKPLYYLAGNGKIVEGGFS